MSARADLRFLAALTHTDDPASLEAAAALDEIDRLRAWKAEAIAILERWDAVADLFPNLPLGKSKSDEVRRRVEALQKVACDWVIECAGGAR